MILVTKHLLIIPRMFSHSLKMEAIEAIMVVIFESKLYIPLLKIFNLQY